MEDEGKLEGFGENQPDWSSLIMVGALQLRHVIKSIMLASSPVTHPLRVLDGKEM